MKPNCLIAGVILIAYAAVAGPEVIIKQRAKELNNQNNVRQGVSAPAQPTQPAASTSPAQPPAQQQTLTTLQADLAAVKQSTPATTAEKQKMTRDLLALAQTSKPTSASAAKLVDDVTTALAASPLSDKNRARFVQELDAVLNPGKYPNAKLQAIFDDIQAIFQADGTSRKDAVKISDGVRTLSTEVQPH